MKAGFDKADAKMDAGFAQAKAGFDRLMWGLLCAAGSIIGLLIKAHGF